jgi:hypothetical protein
MNTLTGSCALQSGKLNLNPVRELWLGTISMHGTLMIRF